MQETERFNSVLLHPIASLAELYSPVNGKVTVELTRSGGKGHIRNGLLRIVDRPGNR